MIGILGNHSSKVTARNWKVMECLPVAPLTIADRNIESSRSISSGLFHSCATSDVDSPFRSAIVNAPLGAGWSDSCTRLEKFECRSCEIDGFLLRACVIPRPTLVFNGVPRFASTSARFIVALASSLKPAKYFCASVIHATLVSRFSLPHARTRYIFRTNNSLFCDLDVSRSDSTMHGAREVCLIAAQVMRQLYHGPY